MHGEVLRLDLRLRRRMVIGVALGAGVYLLLVVAVYPSFKHDSSINTMIEANPAAAAAFGITGSITSPSGWLSGNMYANIAPLLALLLTVGYGSAAIAGQNADGLLGLVASLPTNRAQVVLQKAAALLLVAFVVPLASLLVCLVAPRFELYPDWRALLGVTAGLTLLAFDLGAVALLVGTLTGSQGAAMASAGGISAAAYLVSSLSPEVHAFEAIRWVSPFSWAVGNDQLAQGLSPGEIAALLGLGAVLLAATMRAFRRLDIH